MDKIKLVTSAKQRLEHLAEAFDTKEVWEELAAIDALIKETRKNSAHPNIQIKPGYVNLFYTLMAALDQAQYGKGDTRHATDEKFEDQPTMFDLRLLGIKPAVFQARKKVLEAARLAEDNPEVAKTDLLGAIVYTAMCYMTLVENHPTPFANTKTFPSADFSGDAEGADDE